MGFRGWRSAAGEAYARAVESARAGVLRRCHKNVLCDAPERGEEPPHRKPRPAGRGCVGGAQRRPNAQCALWQRRRAGSRGRDRRRETRARRDVRRLRGITFRRGRGGAAWHDPLRGGRGRVFYGVEALVWRLNTKYRADPNPRRSQSSGSTARTPHDIDLSRLNSAAWVLAVYASCPPRGRTTQHSLPAVRLQTLPGGIPTHWAPAQSFLHSLAFVVTRSWFPSVCALLGAMTPFFLRGKRGRVPTASGWEVRNSLCSYVLTPDALA